MKQRVGILFGGRSAEHEVSVQSAHNVLASLDRERFEPVLIGIDKHGQWLTAKASQTLLSSGKTPKNKENLALVPGEAGGVMSSAERHILALDVVFPVLHGPMGEDGSVQGLLEMANLPYVGAGVLGSAVGMDKDVMKRLLRQAELPVGPYRVVTATQKLDTTAVVRELGLPLFVKPANLGSSVGVTRVDQAGDLAAAVALAFKFDRKVLIEAALTGDEIEVAVLGNDEPRASVPGRIIVHQQFYSYEAKYIDEHGAELEIPADLRPERAAQVQDLAVRAFVALECAGLARVDMFVNRDTGKVFINEINTLPGFTNISMYPKLWAVSGVPYTELVTRLIELALERHQQRAQLQTTYQD